MSDFCIVWLKREEGQGPCVLCDAEIGVGAVGWHQAEPFGPVCTACLLDRERILGDLLMKARARAN